MQCPYYIVDVFTRRPFNGAQISVFPQSDGLSDEQMQRLARETNHSETVFVSGSSAQRSTLRVFSPKGEKGIGSHTTVAAAYALACGGVLKFDSDECTTHFEQAEQGLEVFLHREGEQIQTQLSRSVQPQIDRYVPDHDELQRILGLGDRDIEQFKSRTLLVNCESPHLIVPLRSMEAVYRARYNAEAWAQSSSSSVPVNDILVYCRETEDPQADFHLRLLGSDISRHDDPPVGAAVPAFVAFLCEVQKLPDGKHTLWVERGLSTQRQSLLKVEFVRKGLAPLYLRVGGDAVLVGQGSMLAP